MPPIASSAQAMMGDRWAAMAARANAIARRRTAWAHEVWLPTNPADPANVNAQGGVAAANSAAAGEPWVRLWQLAAGYNASLPWVDFVMNVPRDNALVMWHVMARVYGCALLKMQSPQWPSGVQADIAKFGPGSSESNHTLYPGYRYGQGRTMASDAGHGWPVPMTGTFYTFPMHTAGDFELTMTAQTTGCGITSYIWDIHIWAAVL
jgi:hypothetical protein